MLIKQSGTNDIQATVFTLSLRDEKAGPVRCFAAADSGERGEYDFKTVLSRLRLFAAMDRTVIMAISPIIFNGNF